MCQSWKILLQAVKQTVRRSELNSQELLTESGVQLPNENLPQNKISKTFIFNIKLI